MPTTAAIATPVHDEGGRFRCRVRFTPVKGPSVLAPWRYFSSSPLQADVDALIPAFDAGRKRSELQQVKTAVEKKGQSPRTAVAALGLNAYTQAELDDAYALDIARYPDAAPFAGSIVDNYTDVELAAATGMKLADVIVWRTSLMKLKTGTDESKTYQPPVKT